MTTTFKIEGDLLPAFLKNTRLKKKLETALGRAMAQITSDIKDRTEQGRDVEGASIGRYSKEYAQIRKDAGRQTAFIDFNFTGHMLNSLAFEVNANSEGEIFLINTAAPSGAEQKNAGGYGGGRTATAVDKARATNEIAEWFALSDEDQEKIVKILNDELGKLLGSR